MMILKKLYPLSFLFLVALSGCTNVFDREIEHEDRFLETILLKANNYHGLLQLYRERLKNQEDPEVRFKVAEYYYLLGDYEASRHFLSPLLSDKSMLLNKEAINLLEAKNLLDSGNKREAIQVIDTILLTNPSNGSAQNLKGIILAGNGNYDGAIAAFSIARLELVDDQIVMNNMAMIEILRKNYPKAIEYLMALYNRDIKTSRIIHNLLFALVKNESYAEANNILKRENMTQTLDELIDSLEFVEPLAHEIMNPNRQQSTESSREELLPIITQPIDVQDDFLATLNPDTFIDSKSSIIPVSTVIETAPVEILMNEIDQIDNNTAQIDNNKNIVNQPNTAPVTVLDNTPTANKSSKSADMPNAQERVLSNSALPLSGINSTGIDSVSAAFETASILSSTTPLHTQTGDSEKASLPLLGTTKPAIFTVNDMPDAIDSVNRSQEILAESNVDVTDIRIGDHQQLTRLVIESNRLIKYRLLDNNSLRQMVIEFDNVALNDVIKNTKSYIKANNKTVSKVVYSVSNEGKLLATFSFKHNVSIKPFNLPQDSKMNYRLVFDFYKTK